MELTTAGGLLDVGIEGMTCGSCAARVQKTLGRQSGVESAEVNFATGRARIEVDQDVDLQSLRTAVERTGYSLVAPDLDDGGRREFAIGGMTCGGRALRVSKGR